MGAYKFEFLQATWRRLMALANANANAKANVSLLFLLCSFILLFCFAVLFGLLLSFVRHFVFLVFLVFFCCCCPPPSEHKRVMCHGELQKQKPTDAVKQCQTYGMRVCALLLFCSFCFALLLLLHFV